MRKDSEAAQYGMVRSPIGWGVGCYRREDLEGWPGRWVVSRHVCFNCRGTGSVTEFCPMPVMA